MKKFLPFLTLLFLVSLIAISTYNLTKKQEVARGLQDSFGTEKSDVHFARVQISLPEFSLADLFDESITFSKKDLKEKYSVVNFFASWCTTCHAEHQVLLALKSLDIADIYGIAWRDIDENTKDYLRKNGNPYKKVAKDSKGLFTRITGIEAVPETLIIDPKGDVVMRYRGNLQDFSIEEIQHFIIENKK